MSMDELNQSIEIIFENIYLFQMRGPQPEEFIKEAESIIGFQFPQTYLKFLKIFGSVCIGGSEIYGVVSNDLKNYSSLDAISYALRMRKEFGFPHNFLPIYDLGDGTIYCLLLDQRNDEKESPVIAYYPGVSIEDMQKEIVANDFGEFLLEIVNYELKQQFDN